MADKNQIIKLFLIIIGITSLILGLLGILLPLLPTTPFLLLSTVCLMKSSKRLHEYMLENKYFGSYVKDYLRGCGITLRSKITSILLLYTAIIISIYKFHENPILVIGLMTICLCVSIHLISIPTKSKTVFSK